ncbi:hypothetical protein [Acinetobacter sp. CFCC 10889]|uniref:hypothetical protein n=1 Tax=Acinetobacter sp. CFCC 10889 TaxID=1775557 RepID=UPI000DD08F0A|nr:hypothetical protein [Acinetobacter sp. CFCC 10889]
MNELYYFLLIFGIVLLFSILQLLKRYIKNPLIIFVTFPFIGLLFFAYVTFSEYKLKQYYQDAFKSPEQIKYCGYFTQYVELEYQSRHSILKETAVLFQYRSDQTFLFSKDTRTLEKFPTIANLKPMQAICFQFTTRYKDERNRYILTDFYIQ